VVEPCDLGSAHVRHLPPTERRQNDLVEQPPVLGCGAALALRLGVLGEEAFGEFGHCRRFLPGDLVCRRVSAVFDQAEQPLGLAARRFRCPR
jgi:hypothetical protein